MCLNVDKAPFSCTRTIVDAKDDAFFMLIRDGALVFEDNGLTRGAALIVERRVGGMTYPITGLNSTRNRTGFNATPVFKSETLDQRQWIVYRPRVNSPWPSSTLHLSTPQPWASSRDTLHPKISRSLVTSSRVVRQLSTECRTYCWAFQLNRLANQPLNSPTTAVDTICEARDCSGGTDPSGAVAAK